MAWWAVAIPAVMGVMKAQSDKKRHAEQMKIEAAKEKYSPWTGQHGRGTAAPSATSPIMQGIISGMAMSQNVEDFNQRKEMRQKYIDNMGSSSSSLPSQDPAAYGSGTEGGGWSAWQ